MDELSLLMNEKQANITKQIETIILPFENLLYRSFGEIWLKQKLCEDSNQSTACISFSGISLLVCLFVANRNSSEWTVMSVDMVSWLTSRMVWACHAPRQPLRNHPQGTWGDGRRHGRQRKWTADHHHHHHHHHHQSLNREGRWGTKNDFASSFLHCPLFSTALWDLANSRPVHSLMLSSHLCLCLAGRQQMDNVKDWTFLPTQELSTMASRLKNWKKISAESSSMSPRRPNRSRDGTELNPNVSKTGQPASIWCIERQNSQRVCRSLSTPSLFDTRVLECSWHFRCPGWKS